jgi:hypothetical protein
MRQSISLLVLAGTLFPAVACALPAVSNVKASTSVGLYEKFEVAFDVSTTASNYYWPYDPHPPANITDHPNAVPAGVGVSVDGLFSSDNWQTVIVQPGFYFQNYTYQSRSVDGGITFYDWLYPSGNPGWKIRFVPTRTGQWKFRIRVTDASGTTTYDSASNVFTCITSSNHGFVRVSATDCRYFETSDGTYINFVGLSYCAGCLRDKEALYASYGSNGINLVRPWWQGSQGPVLFGLSGQGGMHEWGGDNFSIGYGVARLKQLFSGKITGNGTACTSVDVKPSTKYRYSAWVKTVGLTGSGSYGVYLAAARCVEGDVPITRRITGNTDWTQIFGTVTTEGVPHDLVDEYRIEWLKVVVDNTTAGVAHFTDLSLKEDLGNGQYGRELVGTPSFNKQMYVSQREAWKADYEVETAKRNGVYLKVVLEETLDVIFRGIQSDGTGGPISVENIYASDTHACRTYQEYFWRYIIARYGYATNIHSFEFCNEGNPFSNTHNAALEAFASYFGNNDPNGHLCTTSNWHSYPTTEMWSQAPNAGYTDWHQYVGKVQRERLQYVYGWLETADDKVYIEDCLDDTVYRSAPYSLHLANSSPGADVFMTSRPIPVAPGHTYTFRWYIKGFNVTTTSAVPLEWQFPTMYLQFITGWRCCNTGLYYQPWQPAKLAGTFSWTQRSFAVTAPVDAHYVQIFPAIHYCQGEVWFDDITLRDDTAREVIAVPNGNFDQPSGTRLDYDTALIDYSVGTQVGYGTRRQIAKPVIRGEVGISGEKLADSITFGGHVYWYTGENQELVYDSNGIWYKKWVWAQINPFGVIEMPWWTDNINFKGLYRYAKAYQAFMSGIPLSNGHYVDAVPGGLDSSPLRVMGQKDLTNNRAHLWIDNINHTWKNVVDKAVIAPVSGTISISGLRDGFYRVEWWDTTTGIITRSVDAVCSGGKLVLWIKRLQTDVACKIYPAGPW